MFVVDNDEVHTGIETAGTVNVGEFTTGQREFLEFHRDKVLLKTAR